MATARPQDHVMLLRGEFDDLDDVMAVMDRAFDPHHGEAWSRSQCAGILPMSGVSLVLAKTGGRTLGFSLHRTISDEAELLLLAVDPEAQGKGVGKMLLDQFEDSSGEQGASRLHLEVRDGNRATAFYEAAGFKLAGRRRRYYRGNEGERIDALTYVKTI
ncbi:ribosomal protein S18-alanine N-acetyltransferase [Sphingomicrobium lutaoense]|uniref:Ribosomal-protein-alanine N-acetyltransferase n=1 Tax=Sphingomicrobium lutaoense TaxID=515949 RepID=A0A839YXN4_9SPHN|nr:ribosomal protein S18-alanine N-acetyltransferase [Sphingomicrobium lutaoense]MBB3763240.1 ribosomal-protein-alanine N-acetyltransferase [Sphingomicrobium lutaoense]